MTETLEQIQNEIKQLDDRRSELAKKARELKEKQKAEEESELSKQLEERRYTDYAKIDEAIEEFDKIRRANNLNLRIVRSDNEISLSIVKYHTVAKYIYDFNNTEEIIDWIKHISRYAVSIDELLFNCDAFSEVDAYRTMKNKCFMIRGRFKDLTAVDRVIYFHVKFDGSDKPKVYAGTDLVRDTYFARLPIGNDLYLSAESTMNEDEFDICLDAKKICEPEEILPFLLETKDKILVEMERRKDEVEFYTSAD